MATANDISVLIGSLGFPIVACIGMFYMYVKMTDDNKAMNKEFTTAINELKTVITVLVEKLQD